MLPRSEYSDTPRTAIGQSIRMLIRAELQDEEDVVLAKIRAGEKIDHYETIRQRKDGTRVNISLTAKSWVAYFSATPR